jgi:exosortase/archaeosortase family protein
MSLLQRYQSLSPSTRFLLRAFSVYALWELCNSILIKNASFKSFWLGMRNGLIENIVDVSEWTIRILGYDLLRDGVFLKIDESPGVLVGPACAGFGLMFAFTGLILVYEGSWRKKLWFIPTGMAGIHLINILRIVILTIMSNYNYRLVEFNHKYVFNTLVYVFLFLMWVAWVRFLERDQKKKQGSPD